MNAATEAREAGMTWSEAFDAATKAGYAGSLQGITKMVRSAEEGTKRKGKGKRKGKRKGIGKAGKSPRGVDVSSLEAVVNQIVKERVNAIIDRAIKELQQA